MFQLYMIIYFFHVFSILWSCDHVIKYGLPLDLCGITQASCKTGQAHPAEDRAALQCCAAVP